MVIRYFLSIEKLSLTIYTYNILNLIVFDWLLFEIDCLEESNADIDISSILLLSDICNAHGALLPCLNVLVAYLSEMSQQQPNATITDVASFVWVSVDMLKAAAKPAPCFTHVGLGFIFFKTAIPSIM